MTPEFWSGLAERSGLPAFVILVAAGVAALAVYVLGLLGRRWLAGDTKQQQFIDTTLAQLKDQDARITDLVVKLGTCLEQHGSCVGRLEAAEGRIAMLETRLQRRDEGHD